MDALIKTHAYGNDFLLLLRRTFGVALPLPDVARRLCDRHHGIGADGLIAISETTEGADTTLFNADGSPAEVSGNGVRCVAAWLAANRKLSPGAAVEIGTAAGKKTLTLIEHAGSQATFRAAMGVPDGPRQARLELDGGESVDAVVLSIGNPHCVILGPLSEGRLHLLGPRLTSHPSFPAGTNVELVEVESTDRIRILIWERGVGPTESSGTGSCAAAIAAAAFGGSSRTWRSLPRRRSARGMDRSRRLLPDGPRLSGALS